ncbi:metallophosphoesterase [Halomonas sp. CUBES01]|uniref:Metallophosphoesterase n=1 Tax=Vreelandella gomseomensis TaxID=370766 RepID=A0ABU1G796_9GAMM|nr:MULTISPECIES: metallophosphoesterase [Halomonas]MDR5873367.1 metallophosphoesterase [Halomonas gomseomensis]MEC4768125.1 metallophosphoesterase [Halomonas sp. CUBES01]
MRLRVLSDLHLEFFNGERDLPDVAADVVILAGDIHRQVEGLAWARQRFPATRIIYVPGNHEFYGTCMPLCREALAAKADQHDIELLDNRYITLAGVRFYGTTLWTDFALYADNPAHNPRETVTKAKRYMPDFRIVESSPGITLTPEASSDLHQDALHWLSEALAEPFEGPKVVISHHAPMRDCIPDQYKGDALSPAFASHLPQLMGHMDLWIHGHVHEPVDHYHLGTRVVANPGGYPEEFVPPLFEPSLVIDV